MASGIRFKPNDPATLSFFRAINLPVEKDVSFLSDDYLQRHNLNTAVLFEVANLVPAEGGIRHSYLDPAEARRLLEIIKYKGQKVISLFDTRQCPGKGSQSVRIFRNLTGSPQESKSSFFSERPREETCSAPYSTYSAHDLLGIDYTDETAPPKIRRSGNSVVLIHGHESRGSGTLVDGKMITARHVVFDDRAQFRSDLVFVYKGKEYPITARDLMGTYPERDVAVLSIPINQKNLKHQNFPAIQQVRSIPMAGQKVWLVGYQSLETRYHTLVSGVRDIGLRRTYTIGEIREVNKVKGVISIRSRVEPGYSGGAVLNEQGEFIATISTASFGGGLFGLTVRHTNKTEAHMLPPGE